MQLKGQIQDIIDGKSSTLLPQQHLRQVGLFLWRKGIEFLLARPGKAKQKFLDRQLAYNNIYLYFDDIWERGAKTGEILLYVKPEMDDYKVRYYDKNQFSYETEAGKLVKVIISFPDKTGELEITSDKIGKQRNPYGFIPCVIIQNRPTQAGRGLGEFEQFEELIARHDWLVDQIRGNLEYFGGPLFYSSRSTSELVQAGMIDDSGSIAADGGYGIQKMPGERIRVRRVIGGLEPGEQIGFATPDPVTPETLRWITDYDRQLRYSLGSVQDVTFYFGETDIMARYSLVIVTAEKKAQSYITNGIQAAFEIMFKMAGLGETKLKWRWTASLFPDTAQTQLTKSIVGRNLLKLGVNLKVAIQHIFPELSLEEIDSYLQEGFAYELLNGVGQVAKSFEETPDVFDKLVNYMENAIYERTDTATVRTSTNGSGLGTKPVN